MLVNTSIYATDDRSRQFVDMALSSGRKYQSTRTNLIHYNPQCLDDPSYDSAPLYENFLFALTLLRDRSQPNLREARQLLDRLLHFQMTCTPDEDALGNFPLYLDQYPQCRNPSLPVKLLPICYWILKEFQLMIKRPLAERLKQSTDLLINASRRAWNRGVLGFSEAFTLGCLFKAFGSLFDSRELWEEGTDLLKLLREASQEEGFNEWFSTQGIGETCIGYQPLEHLEDHEELESWGHFWEWLETTFHPNCHAYIGPELHPKQDGEEPLVSL
ncbi:MAG: hypothetical protein KDK40_02845, partial [Chlamydiia bacterium]|nr:hypothetical protein [Chlamydiia bacterium]